MFSLIWAWTNGWVNNREDGDLSRHRAHYDVTVFIKEGVIDNIRIKVSGVITQPFFNHSWYMLEK